jgi:hypothetical protein
MRIKCFTVIAEIFGAVGTSKPFSLDTMTVHTSITKSSFMHNGLQVFCVKAGVKRSDCSVRQDRGGYTFRVSCVEGSWWWSSWYSVSRNKHHATFPKNKIGQSLQFWNQREWRFYLPLDGARKLDEHVHGIMQEVGSFFTWGALSQLCQKRGANTELVLTKL